MTRSCTVRNCPDPYRSGGYCERHRARWRRYGDPLGQPTRDTYIDEIAVQRAVNGDPPAHLTQAEREEAVRRLHARGLNDRQIGERLGVQRAWARKIRARLGLPSVGTPGPPPGSKRAAA
jgi:hypothetical protein